MPLSPLLVRDRHSHPQHPQIWSREDEQEMLPSGDLARGDRSSVSAVGLEPSGCPGAASTWTVPDLGQEASMQVSLHCPRGRGWKALDSLLREAVATFQRRKGLERKAMVPRESVPGELSVRPGAGPHLPGGGEDTHTPRGDGRMLSLDSSWD